MADKPADFDKAKQLVAAKTYDEAVRILNDIVSKYRYLEWDNTAHALLAQLEKQLWTFSERVWKPGQPFTATGTWHSQPPHLDIGYGPLSAEHGLQAGTVTQLSQRNLLTALAFTVVLGAMAGAAHYLLADQGGGRVAAWWKAV